MADATLLALRAALDQCEQHARILSQDLALLPSQFDAAAVGQLSEEGRRVMDQAAYRFMKLQDVLGEKVLPGLLDATLDPLPPESPFAQKLQRLERLGAIPSANAWRGLREARNSLAHEYPQHPDLQAAQWTSFLAAASELVSIWGTVKQFAESGNLPSATGLASRLHARLSAPGGLELELPQRADRPRHADLDGESSS
jgi:hypothetical protein